MPEIHPAATDPLPSFISGPGGSDWLLTFMAIMLCGAVVLAGVLFFWLHSLPERMAHKADKFQIELIALLCLLSLFTHVHAFWIAALLLAFVKVPEFSVPDFKGTLDRMAGSLDKVAANTAAAPLPKEPPPAPPPGTPASSAPAAADTSRRAANAKRS